ncbi:MAG TPA: hypothetical protein VNS63_16765, partial [Blastocatellia bacterium]|nr:hypothetical protein [Blastocatellia bacterium]
LQLGDNRIQASQDDAVSNVVVVNRLSQPGGNTQPDPSAQCSKINCDCKNVRASLTLAEPMARAFATPGSTQALFSTARIGTSTQDRQAQCLAAEERLRRTCKATGKVSGGCPPAASGPNAWPKGRKTTPSTTVPKKQGVNKL